MGLLYLVMTVRWPAT